MRHITLDNKQKDQLIHLYKTCSNLAIRKRCLCLLLSSKGKSMSAVAKLTAVHWRTVHRLLVRWDSYDTEEKLLALYPSKKQKIV